MQKECIKICVEQIEELQERPGIQDIDIMDMDYRRWLLTLEIVELAGLSNRPQVTA